MPKNQKKINDPWRLVQFKNVSECKFEEKRLRTK